MSRWRPDAQGRLMSAAIELFDEQGYEATTVAEIAERAGLTKRTFFRYFSDKRGVLFSGSQELQRVWLEGVAGAPADATALVVVAAGPHPGGGVVPGAPRLRRDRPRDHRGQPRAGGAGADQAADPRRRDQGRTDRARRF